MHFVSYFKVLVRDVIITRGCLIVSFASDGGYVFGRGHYVARSWDVGAKWGVGVKRVFGYCCLGKKGGWCIRIMGVENFGEFIFKEELGHILRCGSDAITNGFERDGDVGFMFRMHNDFIGFTPGSSAGDKVTKCLGFCLFELCFVFSLMSFLGE